MSQVVLPPLSDTETQQLVDGLLPERDAELREQVARKAEGNPFFAEELARHVESDVPGEIPATVRASLAARIDALPAIERRVLRHAAVVGRTFWPPALETDLDLGPPLRALEARGFVVPRATSALPGHTELAFVHGLTREVAYHSIPRADRCRTHAAVARWIEGRVGDRREEFVELLAYHYEAALAWPDDLAEREAVHAAALRALVDAGDAARRRMAIDQAVRFADRALALDPDRLAAVELKARSFHAAMRGDDALAAYADGIELAKRLGDTAAATRMRSVRDPALHALRGRAEAAGLGSTLRRRSCRKDSRSTGSSRRASPPARCSWAAAGASGAGARRGCRGRATSRTPVARWRSPRRSARRSCSRWRSRA